MVQIIGQQADDLPWCYVLQAAGQGICIDGGQTKPLGQEDLPKAATPQHPGGDILTLSGEFDTLVGQIAHPTGLIQAMDHLVNRHRPNG